MDVEKAETAVLCALEQVIDHADHPSSLRISHSMQAPFVNLHIVNEEQISVGAHTAPVSQLTTSPLRGRLGSRRLGESRYSMQVTSQVMRLMGGKLKQRISGSNHEIIMQFPMLTS